jgi:hypothetical protein
MRGNNPPGKHSALSNGCEPVGGCRQRAGAAVGLSALARVPAAVLFPGLRFWRAERVPGARLGRSAPRPRAQGPDDGPLRLGGGALRRRAASAQVPTGAGWCGSGLRFGVYGLTMDRDDWVVEPFGAARQVLKCLPVRGLKVLAPMGLHGPVCPWSSPWIASPTLEAPGAVCPPDSAALLALFLVVSVGTLCLGSPCVSGQGPVSSAGAACGVTSKRRASADGNAEVAGAWLLLTATNRIQLVLFGIQNRTLGPYLVAIHRILISIMRRRGGPAGGGEPPA